MNVRSNASCGLVQCAWLCVCCLTLGCVLANDSGHDRAVSVPGNGGFAVQIVKPDGSGGPRL